MSSSSIPTDGKPLEKRSNWSSEEDALLAGLVSLHGARDWNRIAQELKTRNGKSCRSRWYNYLAPGIRRDAFTPREEKIIEEKHREVGNRWSVIARSLPGRTDMSVKNYWNGRMKRELEASRERPIPGPSLSSEEFSWTGMAPEFIRGLLSPTADASTAKRPRLDVPKSPIPNFDALKGRSLPYVITISALLIELAEFDDPEMLCRIIEGANRLLQAKKRAKEDDVRHRQSQNFHTECFSRSP